MGVGHGAAQHRRGCDDAVDGAAVGPVQLHGAGPYSRSGGGVKREVISHASGVAERVRLRRGAILEVAP